MKRMNGISENNRFLGLFFVKKKPKIPMNRDITTFFSKKALFAFIINI